MPVIRYVTLFSFPRSNSLARLSILDGLPPAPLCPRRLHPPRSRRHSDCRFFTEDRSSRLRRLARLPPRFRQVGSLRLLAVSREREGESSGTAMECREFGNAEGLDYSRQLCLCCTEGGCGEYGPPLSARKSMLQRDDAGGPSWAVRRLSEIDLSCVASGRALVEFVLGDVKDGPTFALYM